MTNWFMQKNNQKIYNDFWLLNKSERNKKKITESEIRKDYLDNSHVVIAPKRKFKLKKLNTHTTAVDGNCHLCPTNIDKENTLYQIKKGKNWQVKVVGNKYPIFDKKFKKAYGMQELIIDTPEHVKEFYNLDINHIVDVLRVYQNRTEFLVKQKNIEYVLIFKNSGKLSGASVDHSHSQIFATEFVPSHILSKLEVENSFRKNSQCPYCDIYKKEADGPRLVFHDNNFIVICPYASFHSYELMVISKRHVDNIAELNQKEILSLAKILKQSLTAIDNLGLDYNFYFHQVLDAKDQHFYFKIKPRSTVWAGLELGSQLYINPIPPEEASKYYKKYF